MKCCIMTFILLKFKNKTYPTLFLSQVKFVVSHGTVNLQRGCKQARAGFFLGQLRLRDEQGDDRCV